MSIFSNGNKYQSVDASRRIGELDGLRGLAIILVVVFHYVNNQLVHSENWLGKKLYMATSFGWAGVDLFFVLSGFLIGNILIREKNRSRYFSTFYIRRFVRIVPNYYLLLVIYAFVLSTSVGTDSSFIGENDSVPFWSYFLMVHNLFMGYLENMGYAALSITWSIGIEEQFYLIMPLVIYFTKRSLLPAFFVSLVLIAPVLRMTYQTWVPTYVFLTSRMDSLAFGMLIAWVYIQPNFREIVQKRIAWVVMLFALVTLICVFLFLRYGDLGVIKHSLLGILFSLMLLFALVYNRGGYAKFLRQSFLRWIGTISYSLYLFHYLILGLAHYLISGKGSIGITSIKDIGVSVFALITSILFAWLVYEQMEKPFVRLGKKFNYN